MPGIFISYRRDDSGHGGRIYDHLRSRFGETMVFRDIEALKPGRNFVEALWKNLASSDVLIVIVGKRWFSKRLEDPADFVRREIEAAYDRPIPVIPVLVAGAKMRAGLPDVLGKLSQEQAVEISDIYFNASIKSLIAALELYVTASATLVVSPTVLQGHKKAVTSLAFHPDGKRLASGGDDKTLKLWEISFGNVDTLDGHTESVTSVAFRPDGQQICSGSKDGTLAIWNVSDRQLRRNVTAHSASEDQSGRTKNKFPQGVRAICISSDGQRLASGGWDGAIRIWNMPEMTLIDTLQGDETQVTSIAFESNGRWFASVGIEETVKIWNAADLSLERSWVANFPRHGQPNGLKAVAFSPDGQLLASCGTDSTVRLWTVPDGNLVHMFEGHTGIVWSVVFTNDGQHLASAGDDKKIRIWALSKSAAVQTVQAHDKSVWAIAFAPDDQILASASEDTYVKLWAFRDTRIVIG